MNTTQTCFFKREQKVTRKELDDKNDAAADDDDVNSDGHIENMLYWESNKNTVEPGVCMKMNKWMSCQFWYVEYVETTKRFIKIMITYKYIHGTYAEYESSE